MTYVTLASLNKKFGNIEVIRNVDLKIEKEEFTVFVGPSGCGKTTMLRMIAGLETVDSGEIHIDGKRVDQLPPDKRGIAMVFQNYALYPHMSVYENMSFGLRISKFEESVIRDRVQHAARILQIAELLERKPRALSGGQRQRVAIGRAIVREPKVFLFDEPLSNLDAKLRVQMRGQLASLHRELKATMVYVTHDQVEAMTMADKIVVLNKGNIEQIGRPLELYHHPRNRFVASFIGSPSMNFFAGRISRLTESRHRSGTRERQQDPGSLPAASTGSGSRNWRAGDLGHPPRGAEPWQSRRFPHFRQGSQRRTAWRRHLSLSGWAGQQGNHCACARRHGGRDRRQRRDELQRRQMPPVPREWRGAAALRDVIGSALRDRQRAAVRIHAGYCAPWLGNM